MDHYLTILNYFNDRVKSGEIKDITAKTARCNFLKINKDLGLNGEEFHTEFYNEEASLLTDYFTSLNKTTQRRLDVLLQCYRILGIDIPEYLNEIRKSYYTEMNKAISGAPKKTLKYNNFHEFIDVYKQYTEHINSMNIEDITHDDMTKYLMIAFYSLLPPMRPSELVNLKIIEASNDIIAGNYLTLNNKTMYFTDYKTVKDYGNLELQVPDELIDILNKFYNKLKIIDGYRYLFVGLNKKMSVSRFTIVFKRIEGLHGTCPTDLRNLYVSTMDLSVIDRINVAKYMKNSVNELTEVYSKYNKTLYPDKNE